MHLLKTRPAEWRNWTVLEPDGVYHTWWKTVRPILDILADQGNDIEGGAAYPFVTHFTGEKLARARVDARVLGNLSNVEAQNLQMQC